MNTFRLLSFRRAVITLILLVGLLPQMRTIFACESINDVAQFSNCSDKPGEMNCNCDDLTPAFAKDCYDVSFLAVGTSISKKIYGIQKSDSRVKNLAAPQPPPGFIFNNTLVDSTSATGNVAYTIISDIQSAKAGKLTYLHTLRLRI